MKRILAVRLAVMVALAPVAGACGHSIMVHRPSNPDVDAAYTEAWVREIRAEGQSGDLILRRGYAGISDFISFVTRGDDLTHVGIYDAERGTVIEATSPAVHEVTLEQFVGSSHRVVLVRVAGLSAAERRRIVVRARAVVGAAYDYSGFVGIDDPSRFYCTELASYAVRADERGLPAGILVTPGDVRRWGPTLYDSGTREEVAPAQAVAYR